MADKRLRKLTINGETMEIPNQVTLYKSNSSSKTFPNAWATVTGAKVTIDKAGFYLIVGSVAFSAAAETGQTTHRVHLFHSRTSSAAAVISSVDAEPYAIEKSLASFVEVPYDQNVDVWLTYQCARALQGTVDTHVAVYRVLSEFSV